MAITYKPVAIIIDDFTSKSLTHDNVSLYEAGYWDVLTGYDYYTMDGITLDGYGDIDYTEITSEGTLGYYQNFGSDYLVYDGTYAGSFSYYGYTAYAYDYPVWESYNPSSELTEQHGDWSLDAFINQLDSDVEIILIDCDYTNQIDLACISIDSIVNDWLVNNNTNTVEYLPTALSFSYAGAYPTFSQSYAIQTLIDNFAVIVQSIPNVTSSGVTWADIYNDVIEVAAYNVDLEGDSLHGLADNNSVIDIFANGYVEHSGWKGLTGDGWNFGTSFATPRVTAELTNIFVEIFDYINNSLETGEITQEDLESSGEIDYSDYVKSLLALMTTDIYVEVDNTWVLIPVLSDDVETSVYPTVVPTDEGEASIYSITDAAYALPGQNNAPALSSNIINSTTNEDAAYSYDASANFSDVDGDTLTYSATLSSGSVLPSWLSINSTTGVLSGTPANDDTGIYNITITATDSGNATASDTFYLTVNQVNDAPTLSGDFTGSVTKGVETNTATGTLVATDVDGSADPFEDVYFDYSKYTTGSDELGNETRTYTNPQGDSRVTTYKQDENGYPEAFSELLTLANGEWSYWNDETGLHTDSLGSNYTETDEAINSSVFIQGQLYTILSITEDENGIQGTATNANGVSGTLLSDNNDKTVFLTQGSYGVDSVSVLNYDSGVIYTIQEQLGMYGTLALDKNANWTYTLDNDDSDTIGLLNGETAIDSFTIDVSDGYKTISQQIDVSVISKGSVLNGTNSDDTLTILIDTTSVQAGAGTDTIVFSGNYADYSFSQSDSYVSSMTHNTSGKVVSLFSVEKLQFDDTTTSLTITDSSDFQVNTYTANSQYSSSIAALNGGGFAITWMSLGQDGDGYGVYSQMYDADFNSVGDEFQINTTSTVDYQSLDITTLNDGGFIITWSSDEDEDIKDIYAQIYNADGNTVGSEFLVNTTTDSKQYLPAITAFNDGGFIITWTSKLSKDVKDIYAQIYNADGNTVGSEFLVNTTTDSKQYLSAITGLSDGGFVITWQSDGQDDDDYGSGVVAQLYDASGDTVGDEFLVNTYTASYQSNPSITGLSDGGFIITWSSKGQQGDINTYGVYAQMYDADGNRVGDEFQVNTYTTTHQRYPEDSYIAYASNISNASTTGAIVNQSDATGFSFSAISEAGEALSWLGYWTSKSLYQSGDPSDYIWTDLSTDLPASSIIALDGGGFVVTWESYKQDGDDLGVYAQMYDADGNRVGDEFQVNTYTTSDQDRPSIAAVDGGGFAITWTSDGQDSGGLGVYAQMYDADGNALGEAALNAIPVITALGGVIAEGIATISGTATHTDADTDNDDNVFTAVTNVTSTYGTYSVTTAGVWTYVLDNDDATVKALSEGQSTTDTITLTTEDGTTEDITITINGNDIREIISTALTNLGFTSINGLVSTWNDETNTVSLSFNSATNPLISFADYISPSQADISEVVLFILNEMGYSYISGIESTWVTETNELDITFDSSYLYFSGVGSLYLTDILMDLDLDEYGNVSSYYGQGWIQSYFQLFVYTQDNLTAVEKYLIKQAYVAIDALENINQATNSDDIGMIALNALGYTDVTGLSTTWNASTQTATLILDSALYGYTPISYLQLIVTMNSSGGISSYYSAITANGVTGYYDKYDLDDSEVFVIKAAAYAMNEIERITSNHDVTNGAATITFDNDGNLSDFALAITHSDVGVVTKTASNLNDTGVGYLTAMYDQLNTSNPVLSSPIYDASTSEDAAYSYDASNHFSETDDGDTLTYSAALSNGSALPSWLSINSSTGVLSGTPENGDIGAINVTVTATDANSTSISDTYTLTVNNINDTPTVSTTISNASTNEDVAYSYDASSHFSDADVGDTLTYSATLSSGSVLPSWLNINSATGILSGTPANTDIGAIDVAVTATDVASASISDTYTLTVNNVNYDPTGSVTITGDAKTGQTLTASNDLVDVDGLGTISYQWSKDGADISGATDTTYILSDSDIGSTITVTATYTDGDGTTETVTSDATSAITDIDRPFFFTSEIIAASAAPSGDYALDPSEDIIKLTLNVDMARISDSSVDSVSGGVLDFSLDWSKIEAIEYTDNTTSAYRSAAATLTDLDSATTFSTFFALTHSESTADQFDTITITSLHIGNPPTLTLVDDTDTSAKGYVDHASSNDLAHIYLNPIDSISSLDITFGGAVNINQGDDADVTQLSYTVRVSTTGEDVIIRIDDDNYLDNTAINYYQNGTNTNVSTVVEDGGIEIEQSTSFDAVKLSATDAYDFDINITDAIDVLRHIVDLEALTAGSAGYHAADVDNNGTVNITDAIDILRHIVDLETIDTFDLIDSEGARVTELDADATGDAPTWTLVANGDVNMSGSYDDDYVATVDIV